MSKAGKLIKYKSGLFVYIAVILLVIFYLFSLPLAGQLGYEFSLFISIVLVILSSIYTLKNIEKCTTVGIVFKNVVPVLTLFFFIPLVLGLIETLIVFPSSVIDGLWFYLLLVAPNVIIGFSLSVLVAWGIKKYRIIVCLFLELIIAALPLIEIYKNPQVYFYNPIIGYFPGTIYDEGINIDFNIISYRIIIALFFAVITVLPLRDFFTKKLKMHQKGIYFLVILFISSAFFALSSRLNYSTDRKRIETELNQTIETPHFTIHLQSDTERNKKIIIASEHEYYYSILAKYFNLTPDKKINSYIFNDQNQKKRLLGAGNADIAKPWLNEIYIEAESKDHTLKHEIAHCFTADFGATIFKIAKNFNPALIEGIAVAAEGVFDDFPLEYAAANAYKTDYKADFNKLFNGLNFFANQSNLSYLYAGAFTKFLVDNYGVEKFKNLYKTGNFEKTYGYDIATISAKYKASLINADIPVNKFQADYYFGRKSIFSKVCPRYMAVQMETGANYYENGRYKEALLVFEKLEKLSSTYSALIGEANCLVKLKQSERAEKILIGKIGLFKNTAYYFNLELKLGDIFFINGKQAKSDSIYNVIKKQNVIDRLNAAINLRQELSAENRLRDFLTADEYTRFVILKRALLNKKTDIAAAGFAELSAYLKINTASTLTVLRNIFNDTTSQKTSPYTCLHVAKYCYENMDFETAIRIADIGLKNSKNSYDSGIINEFRKKIIWNKRNLELSNNKRIEF